MITKYISCKKILADFYRDVKPSTSDWVYNAIEWISFGLGELGGGFNLTLEHEVCKVSDHRLKLPCDASIIKELIYKGEVLPKYNTLNIDEFDLPNIPFWNDMSAAYIKTSFREGEVTVYYYTVETEFDEQMGIELPLVPDDGRMQVRIFLQEYILMKHLAMGNSHPVRSYLEVKSGVYTQHGAGAGLLDRARASIKFPSTTDVDMLQKIFTTLKSDWRRSQYENFNSSNKGGGTSVVATPINYK